MSIVMGSGAEMKVELHGRSCSCRGGSWVVFGNASASPCSGGETAALVVELAEWRTLGKPADLEAYQEASTRVQAGERREFHRFEAARVPPRHHSEFPIRSPLPVDPTRDEAELCRTRYLQ